MILFGCIHAPVDVALALPPWRGGFVVSGTRRNPMQYWLDEDYEVARREGDALWDWIEAFAAMAIVAGAIWFVLWIAA